MKTIQIPREEALDLFDEGKLIRIAIDDTWRHGTRQTFIIEKDNKFYKFVVRVHTTEGWEDEVDYFTAVQCRRKVELQEVVVWEPMQ